MRELYTSIRDKKFYSLSEVASLCHVTPAAALYWSRTGKIRVFDRCSVRGRYRIPRREVIRVLRERRVEVPGLWTGRKRILVIDDFVPAANFIRYVLERAALPVDVVASRTVGDALVLAGAAKPDLIIVDYGSPAAEFHGMQALALIRQAAALRTTKLFGMASSPGCAAEMCAAGASGFLLKPLGHEPVVRMIRRALNVKKADTVRACDP